MSDKTEKKAKKQLQKKEEQLLMQELQVDQEALKKLKKKLEKVKDYPEKGIETWFRLASRNLYTRRQIVDTKSNILITVNSIILSVVLGSLYPRLGVDPHLIYGIVPMVLANVISIAYAIFATRPKLQKGTFSPKEVEANKSKLMTFDDFYRMPQEDYEIALDKIMQRGDLLYGTIKRDIYQLGLDLSHRYKNIRIAYNVFLIGIVVSVFFFGMCHILF